MDELSGVRSGLTVTFYYLILLVIAILGGFFFGIMAVALRDFETRRLVIRMIVFGGVGVRLLGLSGRMLCMGAPAETKGKKLVMTSVIIDMIGLLIMLAAALHLVPPEVEFANFWIIMIAQIFFALFLGKLATYLQRSELEDLSSKVVRLMSMLLAGMLSVFLITINVGPFNPVYRLLVGLIGIAMLIIMIVLAIRYFSLIVGLRNALERATGV